MTRKQKKYVGYDYENLHDRLIDMVDEKEIDQVIDVTKGCIYETKTITSGVIREVEIYPTFLKRDIPNEFRIKKSKESKKNLNNETAKKYFIRKVNTNFTNRDYYITLVYLNKNLPKNHERAKKDMKNYIDRLNRIYRKKQIEAGVKESKIQKIKYMYVTEGSDTTRYHHHIVMNSVLSMDEVENEWKLGKRNNVRRLDPDELHLTGLAIYLSKDPKGKKRWSSSRNLKNPKITTNASKFSKRKINYMASYQYSIEEEVKKINPGYKFIDSRVYENKYNGKYYIYARMRKVN